MTTTPLTVLDLVPISSGSNAAQALRNSIDLAQQAERLGYTRYWFAEHHLNPGVAGTSPAVVLALTATATSTIRLGSGAVQMGHRTALSTVEEFGLLDALHPGRFDLGLGRSGGRPREAKAPALVGGDTAATVVDGRTPNGLVIPPRFDIRPLLGSPRFAMQKTLLQLPHAEPQNYTEQVGDVLALIAGTYRSPEGEEAHVVPGEGAALQVWILGSSGGESAEVAGERGLRFAANYHVSPATVLEAVDGYRAAFQPSTELDRPYVLRQVIQACRKGGTVSVPGVYAGFIDKVPMGPFMNKGLTMKTGQTHMMRYMKPLLDRVQRGEIDPSFVKTHNPPIDAAPQMYKMFRDKQDHCVKVVMDPWANGAAAA